MNVLIVFASVIGASIFILLLLFLTASAIIAITEFAPDAHEDLLLDGELYVNDRNNKTKSN